MKRGRSHSSGYSYESILLMLFVTIHSFISTSVVYGFITPLRSVDGDGRLPCATTLLAKKSGTKKKKVKDGTISVNRLAYRNYEVIETMTAGVSLLGTEVKAMRDGKLNLRDGFCKPSQYGQCTLHNVHIGQHTGVGAYFQHEERRIRTLLINKSEARKWAQKVDQKGMTVVPLKAFFNERNICKIEIGLCRGKNVRDKRDTIKDRESKREERRIIKSFRM
mmetsp:Transcript_14417/g.18849  ORF Transcript_14417/g.18849 Transcript_14417/m.18849 type:complete len:221 (-) Transcript_14417:25-687(-)